MKKVVKIKVEKLFGKYDYALEIDKNNILLLYGDNGSGKSTILKMIYHLLSGADNEGHRSWIANCPFKSFVVYTDERHRFYAEREDGLIGTYTCRIEVPRSNLVIEFPAFIERGKYVVRGVENNKLYYEFLSKLDSFSPRIVYLTDEREILDSKSSSRIHSDIHWSSGTPPRASMTDMSLEELVSIRKVEGTNLENQVSKSLFNIGQYFNRIVSLATIEGDSNVNQIYLKLLRNISKSQVAAADSLIDTKFRIISKEINEFVKFGLMPSLELAQYQDLYQKGNDSSKTALTKILAPLLTSLEERMSALKNPKTLIASYCKTINDVLLDKTLNYQYGQGVSITSGEEILSPSCLSSGEKQLVTILSSLICQAENSPIFFIDEPEISLNIKWQRNFINMLEKITIHSECQFFLATHSMEILGQYSKSIVNLNEQRHARID